MAASPYEYPTPEMLSSAVAGVRSLGRAPILMPGSNQATQANTGSGLGAPQGAPTKQGFGRRIANAFRYVIAGADDANVLFGPQQPLQPTSQDPSTDAIGRPWDYPVGYNTRVTPRGNEPVGFPSLRALADGYDVLRVLLERVKDKVVNDPWTIAPKKKGAKRDARCDALEDFFAYPDKRHTFTDWLRMVLEQVLVYDALSIWLRPERTGALYGLELLDGSLITPKITADGRTPTWDEGPGFQQVLKGLPAVDYLAPVPFSLRTLTPRIAGTDWPMPELLYRPRNVRVHTPYGYSPVEQMIATVNIALAREAYLMGYYTEGSQPDLLFSVPKEWNPDQIARFQLWWDSMLSGNIVNRKKGLFVPDGTKPFDMKDKALTDETDQWLIRIMCFALGLNPMPFIKMMNRGQEQTHHDEAQSEGSEVYKAWIAQLLNTVIELKFGIKDLGFQWEEIEALDPMEAAQVDQILINTKMYHPDELRQKRGDDPMSEELRAQMDLATFSATANATVLPDDQQEAQNQHALDMQAAKPAPVVAPAGPTKADLIEIAKAGRPDPAPITIGAPVVNVAAPTVHVEQPAITVNTPDVKLGDTFIDAPTSVHVKAEGAAAKEGPPLERHIEYQKNERGDYVGKIVETRVTEVRKAD